MNMDEKLIALIKEEKHYLEILKSHQSKDEVVNKVVLAIQSGGEWPEDLKHYEQCRRKLIVEDGIVFYRQADLGDRILVPDHLRAKILELAHGNVLSGHFGISRTYYNLKRRYFWLKMSVDLINYISSCNECARRKNPPRFQKIEGDSMPSAYGVGQVMSIDFHGPLIRSKICPEYPFHCRYILLMTDAATKFAVPVATGTMETSVVVHAILGRWIPIFGVPETVISDHGKSFDNKLMSALMKILAIDFRHSSPYNPRANSNVEVTNKVASIVLNVAVQDKLEMWPLFLDTTFQGFNSVPHSSTGVAPELLVFARNLVLPMDMVFGLGYEGKNLNKFNTVKDYLKDRIEIRDKAMMVAFDKNLETQRKTRARAAKAKNAESLEVGDAVALKIPRLRSKLVSPWEVGFKVKEKIKSNTYIIEHQDTLETRCINRRHLKKLVQRDKKLVIPSDSDSEGSADEDGSEMGHKVGGEIEHEADAGDGDSSGGRKEVMSEVTQGDGEDQRSEAVKTLSDPFKFSKLSRNFDIGSGLNVVTRLRDRERIKMPSRYLK